MTSKIEWLRGADGKPGYTINPVKGLCPVDCKDNQGKSYCYARRMYKRFKWNPNIRADWQETGKLPDKPSRIFVGSTMELFGDWIKPEWMREIMSMSGRYPQHTFIFLTKQPQNLIKWSPFPENCWVGVSATDTQEMLQGCVYLEDVRAKVKFLSVEPLLNWQYGWTESYLVNALKRAKATWLIIGQQTPVKKSTTPKIEWIKEIVDAADKAGVPVFLKDNLKPLIEESGFSKAAWAAKEWVQCKYPVLRQGFPVN